MSVRNVIPFQVSQRTRLLDKLGENAQFLSYESDIWCVALRGGDMSRLRVRQSGVLGCIFGPKREEVSRDRRNCTSQFVLFIKYY
jgi:hypothetical protein